MLPVDIQLVEEDAIALLGVAQKSVVVTTS
jgi:hypothetical protein